MRHRQARDRPQRKHTLVQRKSALARLQAVFGQGQALGIGSQGQPGVDDFGHQGHLDAAAVGLGLQKLLPGGCFQVADTPPQVQLIAGNAYAGAELLAHAAGAAAQIGAATAAAALALRGHRG